MHHLTIGIFGNNEFLKKLGKQGTINDIMIYNHGSSEGVFTYVAPNSPENKIQPLLQAISMIDVPVIVANELTKELAEQIIAIDAFGFDKGFIISDSEDLKRLIKGTSIENGVVNNINDRRQHPQRNLNSVAEYEWLDEREQSVDVILRERLKTAQAMPINKDVWIPIDNYFNVKSVGTVILSIIKGGSVKKYDKLMMQPLGKEIMVKGIQSQDKDIEEATHGMRAGLSLKGVEADEIRRGYVICNNNSSIISKNIKIEFTKNKYSREAIENGMHVFVSVGLQVIPGKIENIESSTLSISLEHPAVYFRNGLTQDFDAKADTHRSSDVGHHFQGQKCMLASTQQAMPRILGNGTIK